MTSPRGDTDRGAVTVAVALATPVALVLLGLVVDGGYALAAKQRAAYVAENAARAGADALAVEALRSDGVLAVDAHSARQRATAYLRQAAVAGTVEASPTAVTVVVTVEQRTVLLSLAGIDRLRVSSEVTAALRRSAR